MIQSTARYAAPAGLLGSGTWEIDPTHSSVAFAVRHLAISNTRGRFREFSGTIRIGATLDDASAEVAIVAASIDSDLADRDAHLRSPDFLDAENYPTISFRSVEVQVTGDERFRLAGELTVRDVTKAVELDVTFAGLTADPWGNTRVAFSAIAELNREDFGMTWNQVLEAGGFLVGKRVKVEIQVEAVQRPA